MKNLNQKFRVSDYVKERRANRIPLWIIRNELWEKLQSCEDTLVMNACLNVANRIEDVMILRNQKGMALEKDGEVRRAITHYEANVKDQFDGSHPYERLRIIYSRSGRTADVVRVCTAYIDHGQKGDEKGKATYRLIIEDLLSPR